ncbi:MULTISPECIES: heme exporter protein CcmB [Gammaproteobacteria]|uniref:heme exporter protein CcmB n=1 Tax=Gammaproteobacteria TaxID=1236 RepID=UPI000DD0DBBE|nr:MULTISPECIES: heme exporter protein CcmB [Gammaproteobacteria]RTE86117.1 heme exporter protein CcmB [Aliidiomarina sp. B3213]TCZ91470.1 heme exporter protein CcmB [Lysobacter sp. N42]
MAKIRTATILTALIKRDLSVAMRQRSDLLNPIIFLLVVITLFPLGVGPEPEILGRIAPGVIWVSALLSALLGLERLFRDDFRDGALEQMLLLPVATEWAIVGKIFVHWLLSAAPLLILAPLLALLLNLPQEAWFTLWMTLLLGTPVLSSVGAIGVALTVSLNKGGALLSLLLLPLLVPLLIFATAAIETAASGLPALGPLAFMGAILVLTTTLSPFAVHAALRVSVN